MSRLFFGKITKDYAVQFNGNYYAGGKQGNKRYNGILPGDFVFAIFNASVAKLWRVREYTDKPNRIDREGAVLFDVVKEFPPLPVSTGFLRIPYFNLDLNILNKSVKSAESGFFEITLAEGAPRPADLDLAARRSIYLVAGDIPAAIPYKEHDLKLTLDNPGEYNIKAIEIYRDNRFSTYAPLWKLYCDRNPEQERYPLKALLSYAVEDNATLKQKYILAVLEDLEAKGWYEAASPVALYDNILVGRKRSYTKKATDAAGAGNTQEPETQAEEPPEEYREFADLLEDNPNLILYGPPGTGKTYAVKNIIECMEWKCTGIYREFAKIQADNRAEFITFHQSYSYEEFVEGIRPVLSEEDTESPEGVHLRYRVEDGIIKRLANRAALSQLSEDKTKQDTAAIGQDSMVYKLSLGQRNSGDELYEACRAQSSIAIGWLEDEDLTGWDYDEIYDSLWKEKGETGKKPTNDSHCINIFVNEVKKGDIILIYDGPKTIRDIVVVSGDYYHDAAQKNGFTHCRKVKWLKHFDNPYNIFKLNGEKYLTMKTIYPLNRIQFADILEILKTGSEAGEDKQSRKTNTPCYLIIDEINRGNISRIFGELITLIEKDKRDNLEITLPYSRKPFKLPRNLYIIGTMNTADRSIAILDTALRRRFTFYEMQPDSKVIKNSEAGLIEDSIDLALLLDALNAKIQQKYDRDHCLGHAYFLELYNLKAFSTTWYYKIIPLLMEYFYNDAEAVAGIITTAFIDTKTAAVLKPENAAFITAIKAIYGA